MMSDAEESIKFWSELRNNQGDHKKNSEWIMKVDNELECVRQQDSINNTKEDISTHFREMRNCKVSGPNGLHGFWLKNSTSLYQAVIKHLDDCVQTGDVPNWMVESRTVLIQKNA